MSVFSYKAKDPQGNTLVGAVEAPSETVAIDVLREKNLVVVALQERRRLSLLQFSIPFFSRVKMRDVVIFARQLAVMISASVPLVQALRILTKQTESVSLKIIVSEIADEVDGGSKLSAALARYPQVFNDFFVHMIRAGETSGRLDETLTYLADEEEKNYDLRSKIRGAMIYPAFILSGMLLMGIAMMIFVVPQLTAVLTASGAELPMATRALIGASGFLKHRWPILLLAVIAIVIGYRMYVRTPSGRRAVDYLKLRAPIVGDIYRHIAVTRFAQGLSTLLQSGVPLTRALEIVSDIVGNTVYRQLTQQAIKDVEEGNPLSTTFMRSAIVPAMLTQMMNVGEQTGRLDFVLKKLSEFFSREVENSVTSLVTLIEPMILIILGIGVGGLVAAILLPIYNLSSTL